MQRFVWAFLIWLAVGACISAPEPPTDQPPAAYDLQSEVKRFLIAYDPAEEKEILDGMKSRGIGLDRVQEILQTPPQDQAGKSGLHFQLPMKSEGQSYNYSLFAPKLEPGKTYPLVLVLHGAGGNGESTLKRWVSRLDNEFIIACPTYPLGAWWSLRAEKMVLEMIRQVRSSYPVDVDRIVLAGLSNGAVGAFMIGMFHPDQFAGIAPISGTITERYMHFLVNLMHTPVYAIQGRHDPIFPVRYSRRVQKILKGLRYSAIYREHQKKGRAHGGHFLPEEEIPTLVAWMKARRRQVNPRIIRMVREGNHLDPILWAGVTKGYKLAALQIPGPEKEPLNIKDGKIATLIATRRKNNLITVQGKYFLEFELYLNRNLIDYNKPVTVTFQGIKEKEGKLVPGDKKVLFKGMVTPDLEVLLRSYKQRRDPKLLYDVKLSISLEDKVQIA
ncbi:MAG: hypothetical protein ACE5ER_12590, partial [Nitrospinaceae bacterium]